MIETMFQSLSPEIVERCLSRLPLRSLAAVSLASRTMHTLAFPSLYRTVYLCLAPHIENISDRIVSENDTARLQIGTHLRNLVFDDRYDDSEEDLGRSEALARFQSAIPKLKRLNSMSWESSWLPENPSVFQVFQQSCPELRSVSLHISSPWFNFSDENYLRSLQGQNTHFPLFSTAGSQLRLIL
ncbi:hypothetical protein FS749_013340 [Ceratobasidium sp. UAMH 11750]|nr:hypothetical protein FS749_013340 [Ceratobasidium sp. UAMH 11750]